MTGRNNTSQMRSQRSRLAQKARLYILIMPLAFVIALYKTIKRRRRQSRAARGARQYNKAVIRRAETIVAFLAIAFLGVEALFFIWKIAGYFIDAEKNQDYAEDLRDSVVVMDEGWHNGWHDGETEDDVTEAIPALIDFDSLRSISEDAVAWLYAPGTKIDYVVAQAEDNDYYIHRLLDGTAAKGGTLFADYRCSADFTDWNTVIYGHHMKNGSMFAGLMDYRDPDFYKEHPVMYLYVPGKRYMLELIAGYTTNVEDMIFSLPATKTERDEILDHACKNSSFISGITAGGGDKLVTLSTCSYVYTDARYVVIGRIVEE